MDIALVSRRIFLIALILILAGSFYRPAEAASVVLDVPFTSQAPFGEWEDPRQMDGCEEASILMAYMWLRNIQLTPAEARLGIIGLSDYQQYFYGYYQDSSAEDTANLMAKFLQHPGISVSYNISVNDIKKKLSENALVIVPLNPRIISTKLYNKATTRHTVVVVGYDEASNKIIFHDPLFSKGESMRVSAEIFEKALGDYPSGRYSNPKHRASAMIAVSK